MRARANWAAADADTAVTVGNFDGVHAGHRALLARLREVAGSRLTPLAMTFEPHPLAFLDPDREPARIVDLRDKAALLEAEGVGQLNVVSFNSALASMGAREYVEALVGRLGMKAMVVGGDFRFGHRRAGDVGMLEGLSKELGYALEVVDDRMEGERRVSSKAIRDAVSASDFALAARMLGRPYRLSGRVVRGDGMGRKLGWPTANVRFPGKPPLAGVYAAWFLLEGRRLPSAVSVGTRPAVGGAAVVVEAHVIGHSGDEYGKRVSIEPVARLRGEKDFDSLEKLSAAIAADVSECGRLLAA